MPTRLVQRDDRVRAGRHNGADLGQMVFHGFRVDHGQHQRRVGIAGRAPFVGRINVQRVIRLWIRHRSCNGARDPRGFDSALPFQPHVGPTLSFADQCHYRARLSAELALRFAFVRAHKPDKKKPQANARGFLLRAWR